MQDFSRNINRQAGVLDLYYAFKTLYCIKRKRRNDKSIKYNINEIYRTTITIAIFSPG